MKKKRKKRYRIKAPVQFLVMIGIAVLLALGLVIGLLSCTCRAKDAEQTPEETPTPVPTAIPTAVPTATPEPTWEETRFANIRHYVEVYGNCADEAAVEARMATMVIDPAKKMAAFTFDDGPRDEISTASAQHSSSRATTSQATRNS